jgi:hypothetical protein
MKTKEDVIDTLSMIIDFYQGYIEIGITPKEAKRRTLDNYSDFYEWVYEQVQP